MAHSPGPLGGPGIVELEFLTGTPGHGVPPGDWARLLPKVGDEPQRYFEVHSPAGFSGPLPALFVFHGGSGYAALSRFQALLDPLSDAEGFLVVYCAGTGTLTGPMKWQNKLFWNTGEPMKVPAQELIDDLGYVDRVAAEVAQWFPTDFAQLWATGISNGARFVYRLAAERPQLFSAFAPVCAHVSTQAMPVQPSEPVSLIHFGGWLDAYNPLAGGEPAIPSGAFLPPWTFEPLEDTISSWVENLRGATRFREADAPGGQQYVRHWVAGNAERQREVAVWVCNDGGHTFPGGQVTPGEVAIAQAAGVPGSAAVSSLWWGKEALDFFRRQNA
jgi:polyhydroxybutyrate depolymerase